MLELIPAIIGILVVVLLMPGFIKRMHAQGFLGTDMNKSSKPKVAELGGVVVFLGFSIYIFLTSFIMENFNLNFL